MSAATGTEWMFKALCNAMNIDPMEFVRSARGIEQRIRMFGDALASIDYRLHRIEQRLGIRQEVHFLIEGSAVPPPEAAMPTPSNPQPDKEWQYAYDARNSNQKSQEDTDRT